MNIIISIIIAVVSFSSPVHYDIALAGNFGEPRPNHFHGGIDIKTDQSEGKAVYSVSDGYVSKVTVGLYGFGNALYIQHPTGQTSVFCHLKSFAPKIAAAVKQWQYKHRSYSGEMKFRPTDIPVSAGSFIAFSGNSGSSQAPHIHFEIHDTRTWNMLDPLDYMGEHINDKLVPMAHGFMVYPQEGEGSFCGGEDKQTFAFTSTRLNRKFTAWGKVGFAIWANDYMEATYNRYGIRDTKLIVDGNCVFHSNVNNIPVNHNRMINSWGDYAHYLRSNVWYMKSFVEPGNKLLIFDTDNNRGIVDFNQERDYNIQYVITDYKGNSKTYSFVVRGKKTAFDRVTHTHPMRMLGWDRMNTFMLPGVRLDIRQGLLARNEELKPKVKIDKNGISDVYRFQSSSMPLFDWTNVSIRLKKHVKDVSKLYIESYWGTSRYMGGYYNNGWVTGKIRELGAEYRLAYDERPPIINPISQSSWNESNIITIGMTDAESGVQSYKAYIDGSFVLFEDVPKSSWVRCKLKDTPLIKTGKPRTLKFICSDNRNNQKIFTTKIIY